MKNYFIVADDFTGANDTGVQIRRRGIPVNVVFSGRAVRCRSFMGHPQVGAESCVLDTESRALSEQEALQKITAETKKIPFDQFDRVMKKVDSTLRGNIGAETRAMDQQYKPELIIFAPAIPDLGRTTVNRIHHLNGTPLSKTELARDPKTPVKIDDVQQILAAAFTGEPVIHIGIEAVRGGHINLEGGRIFSFDAAANADLRAIVHAALETGKRTLWVGAAALADSLLAAEHPVAPALAVLASLSSVTRGQALFAGQQGIPLVKVPLRDMLEKRVSPRKLAEEAAALLREGKDVILLSSSTYSNEEFQNAEEGARRAGLSGESMGNFTQKLMGEIAMMILERVKISGLFLSGGDTAISCFEQAGSLGSSILTEIAVGIPLMRLIGGKYDGLKVVTKAGAFGREDAIVYGLRKLRED